MLRAVIFDFDGVICESVGLKTEAFARLFADYPDRLEAILKVHMDNGGMSRYRKFEIIYRDILHEELTDEKSALLGRRFSEYCYDSVITCAYVKGAYEFLEKYYDRLLLFVVSGTPEEEIISAVNQRGLDKFFKGVYGSPRMKDELTAMILRENGLKTDEALFLGDSVNDLEGARKAGVRFVGRVHEQYPNPFAGMPDVETVTDLEDFEKLILDGPLMGPQQRTLFDGGRDQRC